MVTMFKEAKVVFKWGSAAKSFLIWLGSFLAGLYYFWDSILDWFKR
jgi:hypothetical protein